jgi:hypothetical protein
MSPEAVGLVIVAVPELSAPIGQIRGLVHVARGHRDIGRRHPVQQLINDETTELSSRV